ncbi:hypothetical protein AWB66_06302 [Caballeronia telluris]|uniref:Uncharacterized protein n=1 Tax=Caballeronia telluris TaxID=326475 RepID=A0A158KI69_9BURK|nr:hypothetical protein AWB66_06302 [Caballeronia telluris]
MRAKILPQSDAKRAANLFAQWAQLIYVLSANAKFRADARDSAVRCTVRLPNEEVLDVSASSAEAAALEMMSTLNSKVLDAHTETGWDAEYQKILDKGIEPTEAVMHSESQHRANETSRTKERQDTIGVSSKRALQVAVGELADLRGDSVAAIARELVADGFEEFERRSRDESPTKLLLSYELRLSALDGDDTVQWMVRLSRHLSIRLKLTAKEYGKSSSQLVAMCMVNSLSRQQRLARSAATETELVLARAAVAGVKGPKVRRLAVDIGIGNYAMLVSGILAGTIEPPPKLLDAISKNLDVSRVALKQVLCESFEESEVPAFKSEEGKPQVLLEPQKWEDAVRSLALTDAETARLMKFKD